MGTNNIWEYWHSREADTVVITAGVSKNRKKVLNILYFCLECRSAWQWYQYTSDGKMKPREFSKWGWLGGSAIPKQDYILCPDCEKK